MSRIQKCPKCDGNIITPAFEGDGVYPVGRMCDCDVGRVLKFGLARASYVNELFRDVPRREPHRD